MTSSFEAYFLARRVKEEPAKSFVRIAESLKEALTLKTNLEFFLGETFGRRLLFFPPHDNPPSPAILPSPDVVAERLAALEKISEGEPFLLVTCKEAFESRTISPELLQKKRRPVFLQENLPRKEFVSWLVEAGYSHEVVVESPGDFAVRGGLIDIFTPQEAYPFRLEFEGDRLVEIRRFDPATQVTLKNIAHCTSHPSTLRQSSGQASLGTGIAQILLIPAAEIFPGEKMATLADYFPLPLPPPTRGGETISFPPPSMGGGGGEGVVWSSQHLKSQWNIPQLEEWLAQRFKIRFICHTPIQAERLRDLLKGTFPQIIRPSYNQGERPLSIEVGNLSEGFGLPEEGLLFLTEEEIFGHKTFRRTAKPRRTAPPVTFGELNAGDFLVHEEHGVCKYKGLKHMKIGKTAGDFLDLEFLGGDKLFLPIDRLSVVQRYVGGGANPPLDSLRGVRWKKVKEKARKEIYKIAAELLKIHAEREIHPGIAYPAPDALDEEFASHFPYDETPDQAQAIDDVLRDMQNPKPMDRLICGDVGYGKTEVAMRSAFKAVGSGRQAALLVPTTILALQHYETFLERFSKLAISVEQLSRFTTRKEQKETLQKLAQGKLDIVIGTHRLLAEDVRFKKLGLLIVDEEHRFGVKHKERIKKLRPTVDVLTLSATPIPRTLHSSLIGLRDLSMIHTPPVDRLSIRTFLAKWDEALIKHAVTQELSRGGQVFFVHNRVATIESLHKRLQKMFPDVAIAIAHGQMNERELEKVMIAFLHQKRAILITTTIIESGIDVPNANTMIVNRADRFGLSELYQLRGRVGRSDRQAYCYLLVPDEEQITADAKRRLSVLTRYTELGAGFQIASHDLEIRGAGNLLGTSQSGFVDEIGYELYTKLLAQTIRKLKGEKVEEEIDPEIQLGISAYLPEEYIDDTNLRMSFYKRMSHVASQADIAALEAELQDRFGPLPLPAQNLLEILRLKREAVSKGLKTLKARTIEEAKKVLRNAQK